MARSKLALLVLVVLCLCGFDTRNPFRTRGPFRVADFTVGGGGGVGTGVESKLATVSAQAHFVTACSEPMDAPDGESYNYADGVGTYDNSKSPDSTECWGRGGNWQKAHYQTGHSQTLQAVTGWGSVQYASNQPTGSGDWWVGYSPSQLATDFGLTAATVCIRYYKQVSSDYAVASDSCGGGTTRNKFAELNAGNNPFQLEEDVLPGGGCSTASSATRGIMACWDNGPGMEPDQSCPWLSPTVKLSAAISKPMRIEQCYETTNIATGANAVVKSYVTPAGASAPYYQTRSQYISPTATVGAPTKDDTWSANLDHTGGGQSWSGYFMFAVWDDVNNHTIGAACEIEGGC